jgi:hypothetical protein
MTSIFGKDKFDNALGTLQLLKLQYLQRGNRTSGWDRTLMAKIMRTMIEYKGGVFQDDDLLHLCFLDALIEMVEDDEAIANVVNRQPVKPKIEELA